VPNEPRFSFVFAYSERRGIEIETVNVALPHLAGGLLATLRNIAVTAPYMHDGSIPDLEGVLDHFAEGGRNGRDNPNKDPLVGGVSPIPGRSRTGLSGEGGPAGSI
jgi:hypothetical protein